MFPVLVSGGLAGDVGLMSALADGLAEPAPKGRPGRLNADAPIELSTHEHAIFAGAIGAALWGAYRHRKLGSTEVAWTPEVAA